MTADNRVCANRTLILLAFQGSRVKFKTDVIRKSADKSTTKDCPCAWSKLLFVVIFGVDCVTAALHKGFTDERSILGFSFKQVDVTGRQSHVCISLALRCLENTLPLLIYPVAFSDRPKAPIQCLSCGRYLTRSSFWLGFGRDVTVQCV